MQGRKVKLQGLGGEELVRVVIQEGENFLVVCREEEYVRAAREKREPKGVGFLKRFLIEVLPDELRVA